MSVRWRDHADHHMGVLLSPVGPFAKTSGTTDPGEPLPYAAPPPGSSSTSVPREADGIAG